MQYKVFMKGYKPLCCYGEGMILYKSFMFYFIDKNMELRSVGDIKVNTVKKLLSKVRIAERLFRLSPKASFLVKDRLFVSLLGAIYCLEIDKKKVFKIGKVRKGFSEPLNFSPFLNQNEYLAVFGDYGSNNKREEVFIYGITQDYVIRKLYVFEAGSVRHIHNIVPDDSGDGYYVLTGDNESQAGIYKANAEMTDLKPIALGNQIYRAVTGFSFDDGLLYATDSVSSQNYIIFLKQKNSVYETQILCEINGSCIHGVESKDAFLFSTTVEPKENVANKYLKFLTNKRGQGIKSNQVEVIAVNKDFSNNVLCSFAKDKYPMKLFQYGMVKFPVNLKVCDNIFLYPIGVKQYDDKILKF